MVERSHLAPFLYYVLLDVDSKKKGKPFLKWFDGKHLQEVLTHPGFLWARRVPLDEPAEDGWKRFMIVYAINDRKNYLAYKNSDLYQKIMGEYKQFEGQYRVQRFSGQVDVFFD